MVLNLNLYTFNIKKIQEFIVAYLFTSVEEENNP